jgi:hypothetical protein
MRNLEELLQWMFAEELAENEARQARRMLLRQLREKFGELPETVLDRVEHADAA